MNNIDITELARQLRDSAQLALTAPDNNRCRNSDDRVRRIGMLRPLHDLCKPANILLILDALEAAQQYAKSRDEENQGLMLTIGRLRVEREQLEASQPVVPELGYFAFWPDNGEEVFKKKEDAIAFCKEAIDLYREDAADEGWGDEVRQVYWGVVAQRATEIEVSDEGHVDYVLAPALQEGE